MMQKWVCKRCGLSVGYWYHGWKHQAGWRSKKSCGQKPIPIRKEDFKWEPTQSGITSYVNG